MCRSARDGRPAESVANASRSRATASSKGSVIARLTEATQAAVASCPRVLSFSRATAALNAYCVMAGMLRAPVGREGRPSATNIRANSIEHVATVTHNHHPHITETRPLLGAKELTPTHN